MNQLSFIVIALFGVALCFPGGGHGMGGPGGPGGRGGRGGKHHPMPPFLRNVTEEARKEFFDIMHNQNETIAQQKSDVEVWAEKYGVKDQVDEFEANMTRHEEEVKQNVTTLISSLSLKASELDAIVSNENQTPRELMEAIKAFKEENKEAADTLFFMASRFGGRDHGMEGGEKDNKKGGKKGDKGGGKGKKGGFEEDLSE